MPLEVIQEPFRGIRVIGTGTVTGEELYQLNSGIYEYPEMIKECDFQIIDFTKVDSLNLTNDLVEKLIAQDREAGLINPSLKIVVVAPKDNIYTIMKMWRSFVEGESFETALFRHLDQAYEWINKFNQTVEG